MSRENPAKSAFLANFPDSTIESNVLRFQKNLRFSLEYFDGDQPAGQKFADWTFEQVCKLLEKLRAYTSATKVHWMNQRVGGGGLKVLEIYKDFPRKSDFTHPKFVPVDVHWARFRMESDMRLIGFFVPQDLAGPLGLDSNVFYIVFLDKDYKFYISEDA